MYHQFRKELYIIKTKFCISSSRQLLCTPEGVMRYKGGLAAFDDIQPTVDDKPSLSAWIKKSDKLKLVGFFGRGSRI